MTFLYKKVEAKRTLLRRGADDRTVTLFKGVPLIAPYILQTFDSY